MPFKIFPFRPEINRFSFLNLTFYRESHLLPSRGDAAYHRFDLTFQIFVGCEHAAESGTSVSTDRTNHLKNREFPIIRPDHLMKNFIRIIPIALQHGHDSHFQNMIQPLPPVVGPLA